MLEKNDNNARNEQSTSDDQLKSSLNFTKTLTDKFAVLIIDTFGSIIFLVCCLMFFIIWIAWNVNLVPFLRPFDPFPFSTLEMGVSIFAIVLSVSVLINQNRQGRIEKIRQQVEFEVNVRAEHEITKILALVHDIYQHMGLTVHDDQELEEMKAKTDIKEIQQTVDGIQTVDKSLSSNAN